MVKSKLYYIYALLLGFVFLVVTESIQASEYDYTVPGVYATYGCMVTHPAYIEAKSLGLATYSPSELSKVNAKILALSKIVKRDCLDVLDVMAIDSTTITKRKNAALDLLVNPQNVKYSAVSSKTCTQMNNLKICG